jgi:Domain of unknown function (DUF397)
MHTPGDDASAPNEESPNEESPNEESTDEESTDEESRVEVYVTTDTSAAPHKADEAKLYVMYDAAHPDGERLYFTEAEWDAFVLGVKDGEFDLDEAGNLPQLHNG